MEHSYLIIGGATRSGTTSLFTYLAAHPQVCASTIKETRYFLSTEYQLPRYSAESDLKHFEKFFENCAARPVRLEATPDYLYSKQSAQRIRESLAQVRLIFVLREPVSRLISWYQFAKQDGSISPDTTLERYISMQTDAAGSTQTRPQYLRSMEQGRYSVYLRHYFEVFDRQDIKVVRYEEMTRNPLTVVRDLCQFASIDAKFFHERYQFEIYNKSYRVKYPGLQQFAQQVNHRLLLLFHRRPALLNLLRSVYRPLAYAIFRPNRGEAEEITLQEKTRQSLEDYFASEPDQLAELLHQSSWAW